MKKLMIAAAAAAMVGGAFADTAYTFSASVKTTGGKSGKTTATYNLGEDGAGKFWYDDASIAGDASDPDNVVTGLLTSASNYFTTKKIGGRTVPALSATAKKDNAWLIANIAPLAATYNEKSAGKWCETFKVTETGCYRVAKTEKFKAVVKGDVCCGALETVDEDDDVITITTVLSQRFGGLKYDAAKKAEIFAAVESDDIGIEEMYIAGQGSIGKVIDTDADDPVQGITSLSGNVVGILAAPECEFCCSENQPAVAFECGGNQEANPELSTAAFGTFSIKYNAKATKAL